MPSSVEANLLDDGVVDTLVSVGASDVHTSAFINPSHSRVSPRAAGVDNLSIGQRVVTVGVRGTWQEFLVADTKRVLAVPGAVSVSSAAQMIINPLTALLLVTDQLDVRPGEWLLQTAAGSTVGKMVLQLGAHLGFKTINVVRRRAAVEEIRALGGNEVICTEDEDLGKRIAEIAGSAGVSKAIDCVAGQIGAEVSRLLAPSGKMIVYGALSTHRQTDADRFGVRRCRLRLSLGRRRRGPHQSFCQGTDRSAAEPGDGIRETGHTRERSRAGHCRYAYAQGFCRRNLPTTSRLSQATVSSYQQVILNLLQNASDAMSAISDRPRQLVIRTGRDEADRVRLTVQDAGVGFERQGVPRN